MARNRQRKKRMGKQELKSGTMKDVRKKERKIESKKERAEEGVTQK